MKKMGREKILKSTKGSKLLLLLVHKIMFFREWLKSLWMKKIYENILIKKISKILVKILHKLETDCQITKLTIKIFLIINKNNKIQKKKNWLQYMNLKMFLNEKKFL